MFLRLKLAIVLAVVGLLVLGLGIGQRTIWLPPASLTASAAAPSSPAPLTVVGPELLKTHEGKFTMTVKNDGPIQLAVAHERDITGWVNDAAHTKVGAANSGFTALSSESVTGAATVPNPAGSDMWVSEETATGELTYTWEAPGRGDWALLLSSDGTAPAPTDIAITVDNDSATPWAVPLMILGSLLLALAALLFLIAPRKPKNDDAAAGRRSAVRPADTSTGALEVDKIVAARRSSASDPSPAPATIADMRRARNKANSHEEPTKESARNGAAAVPDDETSALPSSLRGGDPKVTQENVPSGAGKNPVKAPVPVNAPVQAPVKDAAKDPSKAADTAAKNDDDLDAGSGTGSGAGAPGGGNSGGGADLPATPSAVTATPKKKAAKDKEAKKNDGSAKFSAVAKARSSSRTRWGAAVVAVLLAGSVSPAIADDVSAPSPSTGSEESASSAATEAPKPGFPNLLDTQVQRIAAAVATVVASGDNAKNAKDLEPRVAGVALAARTANYKIQSAVETQAPMEPVNATELLAKVVSTTETWPRSAMFVTKGENNELPQLLTLVQASPRENYKLIKATPLLPGQTFPPVDQEGTKEVALNDSTGLQMSPEAAIAALSDRLTKADSKFTGSFKDSIYITSVFDLQQKVAADAKDADTVFSHTANSDAAVSLRTSDGGAIVVVDYTFGIDATSKADATLSVDDAAAVFTGGKETNLGFVLKYAEPVVIHIPPAGGEEQITILSATRHLVSGAFK